MADVGGPNWPVEEQKLVRDIAALTFNSERDKLEIMELEARIERAQTNIEASATAIKDATQRLQQLRKDWKAAITEAAEAKESTDG